jgi:predicted SnoaL-like aldol condensation-catalyzing enzyme
MATGDDNTDLVRRLYGGLMAEGDTAAADEVLADDYLDHDIPGVGEGGRKELVAAVQAVRAAFPDIAPTLGPILAGGDLVAVRVEAHGTHTGAPFPPGIPASGTSVTWKEVHIFRCADGRIAEHWGVFDMLGILQQLGAVPA